MGCRALITYYIQNLQFFPKLRPNKDIISVPHDNIRYFYVDFDLFHYIRCKSPQWLSYQVEYKDKTSEVYKLEFNNFESINATNNSRCFFF